MCNKSIDDVTPKYFIIWSVYMEFFDADPSRELSKEGIEQLMASTLAVDVGSDGDTTTRGLRPKTDALLVTAGYKHGGYYATLHADKDDARSYITPLQDMGVTCAIETNDSIPSYYKDEVVEKAKNVVDDPVNVELYITRDSTFGREEFTFLDQGPSTDAKHRAWGEFCGYPQKMIDAYLDQETETAMIDKIAEMFERDEGDAWKGAQFLQCVTPCTEDAYETRLRIGRTRYNVLKAIESAYNVDLSDALAANQESGQNLINGEYEKS